MSNCPVFPAYKDLPKTKNGYRCSWSYFKSLKAEGERDQLGTLNFITPERRAEAARSEIKSGRTVSLDLPIDFFAVDISAFGGRPAPTHERKQVTPFCWEDTVHFNTQVTTQWDGFRHFAIRETGEYYGGYTADDFSDSSVLSIDAWLPHLSGRAILLDFPTWYQATRPDKFRNPAEAAVLPHPVTSSYAITLSDIRNMLAWQTVETKPGDILIFRTGFLSWYRSTPPHTRHALLCDETPPGQHGFIGLDQSEELVEWLWDNQIAAVAGDQPALERTPPPEGSFGWLHEHLLAALGCPMGELWDTEELKRMCEGEGVGGGGGGYSFFLASVPLGIRGGVGSTGNAVAIF